MKILVAGRMAPGSSSLYRAWALERLGHQIVQFDPYPFRLGNDFLRAVAFHFSLDPNRIPMNRHLQQLAERERPDVFWSDKAMMLQPGTLKKMRKHGIVSVSYMIDNAFGPRKDTGYRLYAKCIPYFDLHVTQRDVSFPDYTSRGARDVMKVQTAFEETVHFPPPEPFTDADRPRMVSFIGAPYDDRASMLARLSDDGVDVVINGPPRAWSRQLSPEHYAKLVKSAELFEKDYREGIWQSRINVSFLTKANLDEYTHKSFEIAACAGFLLAERSEGHLLKFKEDEEAVFFSDYAELKAKIERYLPDEAARNRIAAAGHRRAIRDGYGNNAQMARIVTRLEAIRAGRSAAQ